MFKLFSALALALLLPGVALASESCHHPETASVDEQGVASGHHAGHQNSVVSTVGIEEVPHTAHVSASEAHGTKEDCALHPGLAHTCSMQRVFMKCGMSGCCIKTELPSAGGGVSPKVFPEMALDAHEGLELISQKGPVSPYLLETVLNYYPPVPRPPSA